MNVVWVATLESMLLFDMRIKKKKKPKSLKMKRNLKSKKIISALRKKKMATSCVFLWKSSSCNNKNN